MHIIALEFKMINIDQINIQVGTIVFIVKYDKAFEKIILIFQVCKHG